MSDTSDGFLASVAKWNQDVTPTRIRPSVAPPGPPPNVPPPPPPPSHDEEGSNAEAMPSLPSSVTGHQRSISSSSTIPTSPPHVSPRSSSLTQSSSPQRSKGRTPSRHLLQTALDLAQRAVEMDKNNDVLGALAAYREAVTRLKSVMERVGADGRGDRHPSKSEEEGRTLRSIHDAYVARIELLSSYKDTHTSRASTDSSSHPSLDEMSGIGNLMLNDVPGIGSPLRSPIQPPPRRTSMAAFMDTAVSEHAVGSPSRRVLRVDVEMGATEEVVDSPLPTPSPTLPNNLTPMPGPVDIPPRSFLVSPDVNQSSLAQRRLSRPEPVDRDTVPPLQTIRHRTSIGSRLSSRISSSKSSTTGLRVNAEAGPSRSPTRTIPSSASIFSPAPEAQPAEVLHRAFHVLRLVCSSMDAQSSGTYLTPNIHISPAIWQTSRLAKAGMPKISALEVKSRLLETLCFHLDMVRVTAAKLLAGDRNCDSGENRPLGEYSRHHMAHSATELITALDGMDEDMQAGYKSLQKSGVPVHSWKGKKKANASWGTKLKDKMTNGKTLADPDKYVDLLSHFSFMAQILNDHLLCFSGKCTPGYACLPEELYRQVESRVTNTAQFFSAAVVPFILDDTMQFISSYLKGGMKYLED